LLNLGEASRLEEHLDLNTLLIDLTDLEISEIEEIGYKSYCDLFLDTEKRGVRKTHDEEDVYFWENRFTHAFYAPAVWQNTTRKEVIDKIRVARIKWILPLISGQVPNSECWQVKNNNRPDQRLYVRFSQNYLIWLEPRDASGWTFSTAYTSEGWRIRNYLKGAQRIWKYGQK
jgi:hypothetical protein